MDGIAGRVVAPVVQTVSNANRTIFLVHTFIEGSGVGLESGLPYLYRGNELNRTVTDAEGFPRSTIVSQRFRVISQVPADDWFITLRYRLILNANGEVVVEFLDSQSECR